MQTLSQCIDEVFVTLTSLGLRCGKGFWRNWMR